MTFFYNSLTGGFANESPPAPQYFTYEVQLRLGQGWHAYGSIQEMQQAIQQNGWPPADASKGLLSGTSTLPASASHAASNVSNDVLKPLFQASIWIRVAEVGLGVILIAIGVAKLTNAVPVATKIAKAVK